MATNNKLSVEKKLTLFKELQALYAGGYNLSAHADFLCSELSSIVKAGIKRGKLLSDILAETGFEAAVVFMVKAGEKSGNLTEALTNVCELCRERIELKKKVIKAVFYPAVTLGFSLLIVSGFFFFIIPRFGQIYAELGLAQTRGSLVSGKVIFILLVIFFFLLGGPKEKIKIAARLELVKQYFLMSFFRIFYFSFLLKPEEQRLLLAAYAENSCYQKEINTLLFYLRKGQPLSAGLEQAFGLKKETILRVKYAEQTGVVLPVIKELADHYYEQFFLKLERLTLFFEPVLIIFTGLIIGGLSFSIIWPVIKLTQKFI